MSRARVAGVALVLALTLASGLSAIGSAAGYSGPAASTHLQQILGGAVADVPTGAPQRTALAAGALRPTARAASGGLPYNGGPVLHANRPHLIFWQPAGSGLRFDPGYISTIETFLKNVAADSHKPSNVYGLTGQYHDYTGPAAYASTFGRSIIDTDRFPPDGCTEPPTVPLAWQLHCVNDAQFQAEIQHVVRVNHLPLTGRDLYIMLTPNGFGSCLDSNPADGCALGGQAPNSYCGYHFATDDNRILYALIPYNAVPAHCQSNNPRPNRSTADPTLSTLSHEHNEIITDPVGDAWIDNSSFAEDGDLCLTDYGPNRGGSGATAWNQTIHGRHYYIQEEWSNDDSSCKQRDEADRISFGISPPVLRVGVPVSFVAHAGDPDGSIAAYRWAFGQTVAHHRRTVHTFSSPGVYTVRLRTTDWAGNYAFARRVIHVVR